MAESSAIQNELQLTHFTSSSSAFSCKGYGVPLNNYLTPVTEALDRKEMNMVLVLSEDDVRKALDFGTAIAAVRTAHEMHATGTITMPNRLVMQVEQGNRINAMPAFLPELKALGMKSNANFATNSARGLPTIHGVIILWDPDTGVPISIMNGTYITAVRTAAASAVATDLLSRRDSQRLGIIGAGVQGCSHLHAITRVRQISELSVFDKNVSNANQLASEARDSLRIGSRVAKSVREVLDLADIVVTATTASSPIIDMKWLKPGTHINAIGSHSKNARELPSDLISSARLVVDSREAAMSECGDILIPLGAGEITESAIHAELGEIVLGTKASRVADDELTIYKAVGIALQDVAAANAAFEQARKLGLGTPMTL
jgi:alanine dehydrogenase